MIRRILFLASVLAGPAIGTATPELAGFFILSDKASFVFVDSETNVTSGWLTIGDTFGGYLIEVFQPDQDTVILKRGDERISVSLRKATILEDRIAFSGKIAIGAGNVLEVSQGILRFDEETVFPLAPGVVLRITATKRDDGNIMYTCRFETVNEDGTVEAISAPRIIAPPGQLFSARVGELSFALQP